MVRSPLMIKLEELSHYFPLWLMFKPVWSFAFKN